MRILHVITSLKTGGAEKLMVDLLPRLKSMGHEVDLCVFCGTKTELYNEIEHKGIRIIPFPGKNVYNPRHIIRLWQLMRNYDIIHTHNTAPQLFAALGSIFRSVTLYTTEHSTSNRRRNWKWYAPVDKWMYSRYQKIICCAQTVKENLIDKLQISPHKCITVNNGIDVNKFINAAPLKDLREGIKADSTILSMVAGFRWEKDQDTVIKAVQILPEHFHLMLIGDGTRREDLTKLVKELKLEDRVHFLGVRGDIPNILKASDYIVMSSHFEGLSLSSIEGMSVGRPMIASDVDGLRQVVSGAGVLFKHSDANDLAAKILSLDSNPNLYHSVSEACLQRAQQYDVSLMAIGYEQIYRCLAKSNN